MAKCVLIITYITIISVPFYIFSISFLILYCYNNYIVLLCVYGILFLHMILIHRQQTQLKDGAQLPPPDQLIRQLVELANSENPPCANCDKRDKSTMFFCTTCGTF